MWSRRTLIHGLPWILLSLVSISGLALLDWALLATAGPRLGPAGYSVALIGLLAFNTAWMLLARRLRRAKHLVFGIGNLLFSLGVLASGGMITGVFAAVHVLDAWMPSLETDHWLLWGGGIGSSTGLAVLLYSMTLGQRRVSVEQLHLRLPMLHPELEGLRVAHISDLHIGANLRASELERLVDRVNAVRPDLIVITGDIFDFDPSYIEEGCRRLAKLYATHGVFAILGNHDVYTGADQVAAGIRELTPIHLLRDSFVQLTVRDAPLWIVGIEDTGHGMADRGIESQALERLASALPRTGDRILLVHRPNYLPQIERLGFPLALAGHTHGGQVSLPMPIEHWNVARVMTPWTRGLITSGATRLYVNRGLGVGGIAMRLNCPREIAVLTLQRDIHDEVGEPKSSR